MILLQMIMRNRKFSIIQNLLFQIILNKFRQIEEEAFLTLILTFQFFLFLVKFNYKKVLMKIRNISNSFQKVSNNYVIKRRFQIGPIKWNYQANNQIDHSAYKPIKETLSVINVMCQKDGDKLNKVIQIQYGQKVITIKDHYHIDKPTNSSSLQKHQVIEQNKPSQIQILEIDSSQSSQNNSSNVSSSKNQSVNHQFGGRNNINNTGERLTNKNTIKNILRAFYQYCRRYGSSEQKQYIKLFISNNSFTNSIVLEIINHEYLSPLFQRFLRYQFDNWINVSRVKNKEGHRKRAQSFLRLMQNAHLQKND